MTKNDLEFNIASSNLKRVNVVNPIVKKGGNSALVFGKTGTIAPKDCEIEFYVTDNDGVSTITGNPYGPVKESLSLTVEPLIPKILAGTNFPIIGYLMESSDATDGSTCYSSSDEDESGRFGVTQFTEDTILTFSADELLEIDSAVIKQNQPFMLMDVQSKKIGLSTIQIRGTDLSSTFSLQSHTTDPTSFSLTFPETTLPGTNALLALQALDSGGNPVYAKEDIEVSLVSNNESVLEIPDSLVIQKDDYRTIFEIFTKAEGSSEIALLSEGLPLANFNLNVKGMAPVLNMQIAGSGLIGEPMTATLTVSYPGVNVSAEGMDVKWDVSGAEVVHQRAVTDENGKAVIEIISYNPITASIKASVSVAISRSCFWLSSM